jgi:hypothetical protein
MADEFDRAVLFAAYRMAQVPGSERHERVLARLRDPDDRPVFLPSPQRARRPSARVLPLRIVLLAAAAGLLAVLGLSLLDSVLAVRFDRSAVDQAVDAPEAKDAAEPAVEREQHVSGPRVREAPSVAAIVVPPPPVAVPPVPAVVPEKVKRKPAVASEPAAPEPEPEPAREPTAVEIEEAIIADALAALDRNDWKAASAALGKHAKQFPGGKLELERNALKVVVRCKREHGEASRAQARDFIVSTALSPHWQRIIDACRATAPPVVDPFQDKKDKNADKDADKSAGMTAGR